MVLVEHDMELVMGVSDRVVVLMAAAASPRAAPPRSAPTPWGWRPTWGA